MATRFASRLGDFPLEEHDGHLVRVRVRVGARGRVRGRVRVRGKGRVRVRVRVGVRVKVRGCPTRSQSSARCCHRRR